MSPKSVGQPIGKGRSQASWNPWAWRELLSPGSEEEKSSRGKAFIDPAAVGVSFARKSLVSFKDSPG